MPGLVKYAKIEDILIVESIRSSLVDVFRAMTVSKVIDDWGGGPARVQPRVNGKYSLWDGEMSGLIKEIDFPHRLSYTLREASWDSSQLDSLVAWELEEGPRGTRLTLRHSGLPTRRIREIHNEGWGEYYLGPLKAYLEKRHPL